MSGHYRDCRSARRGLYRDKENGVFMGVCAGIADRFDLSTLGVRIITVILWFITGWTAFLIYLAAGFLLRDRPLCYCGRDERRFWSGTGRERQYHG